MNETLIKIIASLSSPRQFEPKLIAGTDAVEIRLDLITEPLGDRLAKLAAEISVPIILTVRSSAEGGAFAGDSTAVFERIEPYLKFVQMVDLEQRFEEIAELLRKQGKKIISSCHMNHMPSVQDLETLINRLRNFGDIPKIAVQPRNQNDLLDLLTFTKDAEKPLIVSVTGTQVRYARPLLCLFGSLYTYCYVDSPTSPGQYSIWEMRLLSNLLTPGSVDTWYEGRPVRSGDPTLYLKRTELISDTAHTILD